MTQQIDIQNTPDDIKIKGENCVDRVVFTL